MQASKIKVWREYMYCPGQNAKFDFYYKNKWYGTDHIFKVRVLAKEAERWSSSKQEHVKDGIQIAFVDTGDGKSGESKAVVPANRLKREWESQDDDHFKSELQSQRDFIAKRIEMNQKRESVAALVQYQETVLQEEGDNITDILEANGLELGVDFSVEKYDRGITLRGDGIKKLIAILGV